ncbi:MAG: hypothetical protein LBU19_08425 [Treponema sp.]|jgi:hypothetical protein|nr:hypothetical protein [Treponema sp.]
MPIRSGKPGKIAVFLKFHRHVIRGVNRTEAELRDYNIIVDYFSFDGGDDQEEEERFLRDSLRRIASGSYDGLLSQ